MWFEPRQSFAFANQDAFRVWLDTVASDASAHAAAWKDLAAEAQSAVTLVTCSSDFPRQRWRTFVVFVETREETIVQDTTP